MRQRRKVLISAAAVCGVLAIAIASGLYALQTSWFKDAVRERAISAIERATGGRVDMGSFRYDWRTFSAEFRNFVVHGDEPRDADPLFRADSVRVGLRIVSVFKREVDIASLAIEHPELNVEVGANGQTNFPHPRAAGGAGGVVQRVLDLRVRHFEARRGTIRLNGERVPLSVRGENVSLSVGYDAGAPQYDIALSTHELHFDSERFPSLAGEMDARAVLQNTELILEHVALGAGTSKLDASGRLIDFAHPRVQMKVNGSVPALEFAAFVPEVRGGELAVNAEVRWDEVNRLALAGKVSGHNLAYQSSKLAFRDGRFESEITASSDELQLTHVTASALGGRVSGNASVTHLHELRFDGDVSGVSIREIGLLAAGMPVAWSGVASGPVHVQRTLDKNSRDLTLATDLKIAASKGGIPIAGQLSVSYKERGDVLELAPSHLDFPSSRVAVSGRPGTSLQVAIDTTNLDDLQPTFWLSKVRFRAAAPPLTLEKGSMHFEGRISGDVASPRIEGTLALDHFRARAELWDQLRSQIVLSANEFTFNSLQVVQGGLRANGNGTVGLRSWRVQEDSRFRVQGKFEGADVTRIISDYAPLKVSLAHGLASGSLDLAGSIRDLHGKAQVAVDNLDAYGQPVNRLQVDTVFNGRRVEITRGQVQAGRATIAFAGTYDRAGGSSIESWIDSWREGEARLKVDTNGFPLASLSLVRKYEPGLNGGLEVHAEGAAHICHGHIQPEDGNGTMILRNVSVRGVLYGDITASMSTQGQVMKAKFSGDLRRTEVKGGAEMQLTAGAPFKGDFEFRRIDLGTVYALVSSGNTGALPLSGFMEGGLTFNGSLDRPGEIRSTVRIDHIEMRPVLASEAKAAVPTQSAPNELNFHNVSPIVIETVHGIAIIRNAQLVGKDTKLSISGSIPYVPGQKMEMRAEGSLDLAFLQMLDPRARSSGRSQISADIRGTIDRPAITGSLEVRNGSFFLENVPNGLSGVNGTVRFDRDRAVVERLTARSGGGDLAVGGFVSFAAGGPPVYHLEANAQNIRMRYGGGISVTASSGLRFTGTSTNSLLSGTVTISRVVFNPNADVGNVLTTVLAPTASPSNENDFLTGVQLDVRIQSSPDLQLSTSLSRDIEAQIDLRLRGRPDNPVLLGTVSANQGDIKVFGTKYSLNRGEIDFTDPVKIEPVLDLDLQTQARGITVDITIAGTLSKLNVNYRSDPPLQPRDIVALLTVGRTPTIGANVPTEATMNDITALQSSANTVLGQAISPNSNRLSRLFGITNIKIDPLVQGITNTPQSRLTVEQQISRDVTITYITNLSETSEQIFRFEWALNRQYSLIALRDDNGEFGIDLQYKKRFK